MSDARSSTITSRRPTTASRSPPLPIEPFTAKAVSDHQGDRDQPAAATLRSPSRLYRRATGSRRSSRSAARLKRLGQVFRARDRRSRRHGLRGQGAAVNLVVRSFGAADWSSSGAHHRLGRLYGVCRQRLGVFDLPNRHMTAVLLPGWLGNVMRRHRSWHRLAERRSYCSSGSPGSPPRWGRGGGDRRHAHLDAERSAVPVVAIRRCRSPARRLRGTGRLQSTQTRRTT